MTYYFMSATLLTSKIYIAETKELPNFTNIFIDTDESLINYHAGLSIVLGTPLKTIYINKIYNNHLEDHIIHNLSFGLPKTFSSTNLELLTEITRIIKTYSDYYQIGRKK